MRSSTAVTSHKGACSSQHAFGSRKARQAASRSMTSKTSTVMTMPTALLRRRRQLKTFASSSSTPQANSVGDDAEEIEDIPEDELLLPDEDWTVPGGANDSLTSNTPLGRAVGGACDELEALAELERDAAVQAANLLKKLGYRGNLLDNPPPLPEKKKKATEE